MGNIKEILSENRDSVISSLKYIFRCYKHTSLQVRMKQFLAFCEDNMDVAYYEASTAKKTYLKNLVCRMKHEQEKAYNLQHFGTETPKLADIMGGINRQYEREGKHWDPMAKDWVY